MEKRASAAEIGTLQLGMSVVLFCEGRLEPGDPAGPPFLQVGVWKGPMKHPGYCQGYLDILVGEIEKDIV